MKPTRRVALLALTAFCSACVSSAKTSELIIGRWRDVRYQHVYEFLPDGSGRFELYVPTDGDPALSAVLTPSVSWRRVRAGYEITLQTRGLDGGFIVQRGVTRLDGHRLSSDIEQREGTLTLERVS